MMYFVKNCPMDTMLKFIEPKLSATMEASKYGIQVEIRKQCKKRTPEQNRLLWAIYQNIVRFWNETGFIPDSLPVKFVNSDFLHEYFKLRFDTPTTTKLTTAEMMDYCDRIQNLMIEQTHGEYEPIVPENTYMEM